MTMEIDNITLAVIVKKLEWATEEMNTYLTKSAYSSNIKIRKTVLVLYIQKTEKCLPKVHLFLYILVYYRKR